MQICYRARPVRRGGRTAGKARAGVPTDPNDYANFAAAISRKGPRVKAVADHGRSRTGDVNTGAVVTFETQRDRWTAAQQVCAAQHARILDAS